MKNLILIFLCLSPLVSLAQNQRSHLQSDSITKFQSGNSQDAILGKLFQIAAQDINTSGSIYQFESSVFGISSIINPSQWVDSNYQKNKWRSNTMQKPGKLTT